MPVAIDSPIATIPRKYFARSFGDPLCHMFWTDDECLCCGILPAHKNFFASLMADGVLDELVEEGFLAPFTQVDEEQDYPLSLRIQYAKPVSYIYEWSYAAWQDAARFYLDLLSELAARGLTIRNPHIWNLAYDGKAFRLLNCGSIVKFSNEELSRSLGKLERFLLNPLTLVAQGSGNTARNLLRDIHEGVPNALVLHEAGHGAEVTSPQKKLSSYRERVNSINASSVPVKWTEYYEQRRFEDGSSWNLKAEVLRETLCELQPVSVLDIGGNVGHYSRIAAEYAQSVVCCDVDDAYVSQMHRSTEADLAGILPLVIDITNPSPALGVDGGWFAASAERLRADLVLAFALEHHLVFGRFRLNFDQFARAIWSFSSQCALVEFVAPYDNLHPERWRPDCVGWYHAEGFQREFERYFDRVRCVSEAPDGRLLFRCDGPRPRMSL
jgi:hypothetical protein